MARQANKNSGTVRVWYAAGSTNPSAVKPIWPVGFHDIDQEKLTRAERDEYRNAYKRKTIRYRSGEEVNREELDTSFSLIPERKKPSGPQPLMNFGGSWTIVTAETRRLLKDLKPGRLRFDPVEVLNAARTAPLWEGADLHIMQVLTCRREVLIEESYGIGKKRLDITPDGTDVFMIHSIDRHDALVVAPPERGGAEMWLDDRLMGALFMSDRVATALKAAKLTRGWSLKRCVVKAVH